MSWLIGLAVPAVLAIVGLVWYYINRFFAATQSSVADKALAATSDEKAGQLEAQRKDEHEAAMKKDVDEGTAIVRAGDGKSAIGFLRDSLRSPDHSN